MKRIKTKKIFKGVITSLLSIMMILTTIIPAMAVQAPTPDVSPWAIFTLNEGEKYDIYPMDWYYSDFRAEISQERLDALVEATDGKIAAIGLEKKENFIPVASEANSTRGNVVTRLFNVIAQYQLPVGEIPSDYMQQRGILQGTAKGLELDQIATTEHAVILATRLVEDTYNLAEAGSKGLAWKVEHNGNVVYLLGSIHIGNSELYPIDQKLLEAFYSSDALLVEANPLAQEAGMAYFMEKSMYQDGTLLEDVLSEETYERLLEVLEGYGLPTEVFLQFKPWSLANNLSVISMTNSGDMEEVAQLSNLGIDMYFIINAYLTQKPIFELEGIEYQADLFDGLSLDIQIEYLEGVIESILEPQMEGELTSASLLEEWINQWIAGDIDGFKDSFNQATGETEDEFSEMLFGQRDQDMAEKIIEILESEHKGTYFIVVGAGHLIKDNTIIYELKKNGYNVELFQ